MFTARRSVVGHWGWNLLLCLLVATIGCSKPDKTEKSDRSARRPTERERRPGRATEPSEPRETQGESGTFSGTELWLFGAADAKLAEPFDARGVRLIVDLRTIQAQKSISFLNTLANRDMGIAICVRWKNPRHEGDRARGKENVDIPPTSQESTRALDQLRQILASEPAKKMGSRFYVGIYNEIGGGPGRFALEDVDEMFAFADKLVPLIRSTNPNVRISGPALSGGQLAMYDVEQRSEAAETKAEIIQRWIKWSAQNVDVQDVHLNGIDVDAAWADRVLTTMRTLLDREGGQHIDLVSMEWSCSGYRDRNDAAGIRKYIEDMWATMHRHKLEVAAYTYWPLIDMPGEMMDKTSWASVVGPDKRPNQVVWDALVALGKSR